MTTLLKKPSKNTHTPLVFSCSGCSNLGQMAHNISLTLDGDGIAQMSCVAGVTANVDAITEAMVPDRSIITIDGCELACTKTSLDKCDVQTDYYFNLAELGFEKKGIWNDSLLDNTKAIKSVYMGLIAQGIEVN